MKKILICYLLLPATLWFTFSNTYAQNGCETREQKLGQLKSRSDIKVTEVEPNLVKLEYLNGKVLYKNIADYQYPESSIQQLAYSPTYDSNIIDIATLDTALYYQKYSYWQEVPLGNFRTLLVGDVNNNGKPELYGQMKDYSTDYTDIYAFELNHQGIFVPIYKYDSTVVAEAIFDVDKNSNNELRLMQNNPFTLPGKQYNFYQKENDTSLAKNLFFIFSPYDSNFQQNDVYFGDWDGDALTDQVFYTLDQRINIFEYSPMQINFNEVYRYNHSLIDLYYGGFSIGDFDQDGKTEFLAGSVHGKVLSLENCGNNCYAPNWQGMVETYNAYLCAETNDLDGNGKKEIWIGGDAFYSGQGITRITIFEANGNNSYHVVGRIDIKGIFSFDAGNVQVVDVDKDGKEEVLFGLDMTVLILKFNGWRYRQTYEVFYYKRHNWENNHMGYYGANLYNLIDDQREELLINMWDDPPGLGTIKWFNWIYKPNFTVDVEEEAANLPTEYQLYPSYPNPFNPLTTIKFDIARNSFTTVKVYNILGKEIETLLEKELSPGTYSISWEARDSNSRLLPSGVYLVRLTTDDYTKTIKAILLR